MNCQVITHPTVTNAPSESMGKRIVSLIRSGARAWLKYWTEGSIRSAHIESQVRNAREEIFLKYGHLMMK